jgi:biotin-dependent carboxylase-like uncharacterized protein
MINVLKPGFYTTIQDLGRFHSQEYGIPISGAMDSYAYKLANSILGNSLQHAVLEITMTGPTLEFRLDTAICITGADVSPTLDGVPIQLNQLVVVKAGAILSFGKLNYGFRAYVAVKGGFQTELVMNSRSFYKNITKTPVISRGDVLQIKEGSLENNVANASVKINTTHFTSKTLEVFRGPEFDQLDTSLQELVFSKVFSISKYHSRMAYQLNENIINDLKPIITSFVLPGTVQLTPSGKLIVLMKDCQTTGGYPRVLQLSENSINQLAQKQTGDHVQFRLTVL